MIFPPPAEAVSSSILSFLFQRTKLHSPSSMSVCTLRDLECVSLCVGYKLQLIGGSGSDKVRLVVAVDSQRSGRVVHHI